MAIYTFIHNHMYKYGIYLGQNVPQQWIPKVNFKSNKLFPCTSLKFVFQGN